VARNRHRRARTAFFRRGARYAHVRPLESSGGGRAQRSNALAALAAARHAGVPPALAIEALTKFRGVKRRMEERGSRAGITVYDDFAHHPTSIATTVAGLRRRVGVDARILAILEPRSNTMKLGAMKAQLPAA